MTGATQPSLAVIDRILGDGAARAEALAAPVMAQVYDIVGMVRRR